MRGVGGVGHSVDVLMVGGKTLVFSAVLRIHCRVLQSFRDSWSGWFTSRLNKTLAL